ncbi:hypothetical protein Nepgr_021076 [Nepenthes gracilis]|uniref:Uncharacterized protein n=1 Tax=Nepenthes gracilis TaxID=150966 RepID=A0AAD3SWL7_NEPGR|nr:hypothetical protein Nepgr_021076 [Nepenthes gracilis]
MWLLSVGVEVSKGNSSRNGCRFHFEGPWCYMLSGLSDVAHCCSSLLIRFSSLVACYLVADVDDFVPIGFPSFLVWEAGFAANALWLCHATRELLLVLSKSLGTVCPLYGCDQFIMLGQANVQVAGVVCFAILACS